LPTGLKTGITMEALKSGAVYGAPRGDSPAVTAIKPAKEGNHPQQPAGWDPFEVWRTRVRDVQQARTRDENPSGNR
jgi:hypothetical protein